MHQTYRAFLEFVGEDLQRERRQANRRMLSVFIWCFLAPVVLSIVILLLVKIGVIPQGAKKNLDWLILVFPVVYSIYILGSEVIAGIPSMLRRGGLVHSLRQAETQSEWRERVCEAMKSQLKFGSREWNWVLTSFRVDLEAMLYRAKYLTALAGAVFFLLLKGIDSLTEGPDLSWLKNPVVGWVETSNTISQLMALALFLVLLYLTGSQAHQSLRRYMDCAEIVSSDTNEK
jgi:hypothetical protein